MSNNKRKYNTIGLRDLRRIWPMLGFKIASTIETSIVHLILHNCNFFFLNLDTIKYSVCSSSKTQSHGLLSKRQGIIVSLLSLNHFTAKSRVDYCRVV